MKQEQLYDGKKLVSLAVLPQGEQDGFFLVREFDIRSGPGGGEPLLVKAMTLELANGESLHLVVKRQMPTIIGGLEWALAKVLKRLVDEASELIQVNESGRPSLTYKDLANEFNAEYRDDTSENGGLNARTVGEICRETFGFPVHRTNEGWAVFLDEGLLQVMVERFELGALDVSTAEGDDFIDRHE